MNIEVVVSQSEIVVKEDSPTSVVVENAEAPVTVEVQNVGVQGLRGPAGDLSQSFESVSQNIKDYPHVINYADDKVSTIVYTLPGGFEVTKTLNYTGDKLTSIVLSGDTPSGINLTKTLNYTGDNLSSVSYS